jgi:hypothetical protein
MSRVEDIHLRDTRANQPAAATAGTGVIFYVTDEGVTERSNGSAWEDYSDTGGGGITQLTSDVTAGPGTGSQAATIANDAVTNAKAANMAADTIKGRAHGAGTGDPTDLTANQASAILDTATDPFQRTSTATSGITQLTSDVTAGPGSGSQAATIANDAVTNAKAANMAQSTIKGRAAAAGTGDPTDLTANQVSTVLDGATDPFLRTSATTSGITQLTGDVTAGPGSGSQAATIANDAVTYAKIQNVSAASKLLGRGSAGGSGDTEEITVGSGLTMTGTTLSAGSAGAWTSIDSGSLPTGAAVKDVNGLASYSEVMIVIKQVTYAISDETRVRVSIDNGANFLTAGGDYVGIQGSGAESSADSLRPYVGSATAARSGFCHIMGINLTVPKLAQMPFFSTDGVGNAYIPTANAITAIRIFSSGAHNFSGGTYAVYAR